MKTLLLLTLITQLGCAAVRGVALRLLSACAGRARTGARGQS
jgi:hypothetical protein